MSGGSEIAENCPKIGRKTAQSCCLAAAMEEEREETESEPWIELYVF